MRSTPNCDWMSENRFYLFDLVSFLLPKTIHLHSFGLNILTKFAEKRRVVTKCFRLIRHGDLVLTRDDQYSNL